MKKQKGGSEAEIMIGIAIIVIILLAAASCQSKHKEEFYEYCHTHNGHVISEGHSFLSAPSSKHAGKLREICIDSDGKIVE